MERVGQVFERDGFGHGSQRTHGDPTILDPFWCSLVWWLGVDARGMEALLPAAGFLGLHDLITPPVTSTVPPISAASGVDPAALERAARPNSLGRYGQFGGQYVPETLIPALAELEQAAAEAWKDPAFTDRLNHLLRTYVGRPNPLYEAERLTEHYRRSEGGPRIWLKREDLNHTGAHKINNALGQALLALRMGKKRIIAETGAGQHGVATATVCARFGLECVVYMGA